MARKRKSKSEGGALRNRVTERKRLRGGELLSNPGNWREHPPEQRRALEGILREVGQVGELYAYHSARRGGALTLIDGHLRVELSPEQEWDVAVTDLSDEEADKLLLSMDPIAGMAAAGREALDSLLRNVQTGEEGLAQLFDKLAMDSDLVPAGGNPPGGGGDEFDAEPEAEGPTRTALGDVWEIDGGHRLFVGDCTDEDVIDRLLMGDQVFLIITSPPYNQKIDQFKASGMHKDGRWVDKVSRLAYADTLPEDQYQSLQSKFLSLWYDHLLDGGSLFYNHKHRYRNKQVVSPLQWVPGPFNWRQEIIWRRPGSVTQDARMFLPADERIYWLYKGSDFYFDDSTDVKSWSTVWDIKLEANNSHAVGFPTQLPARIIEACSRSGDLVADPYCGSGTTLIAAHRLGRRFCGCEIEPRYADVVLKRAEAEGLKVKKAKGPRKRRPKSRAG